MPPTPPLTFGCACIFAGSLWSLREGYLPVFACPGSFWKVVFVSLRFLLDRLAIEDVAGCLQTMKCPLFAILQVIDAAGSVFFWVSLPSYFARGAVTWTGVSETGSYGEETRKANTCVYQHNKQ